MVEFTNTKGAFWLWEARQRQLTNNWVVNVANKRNAYVFGGNSTSAPIYEVISSGNKFSFDTELSYTMPLAKNYGGAVAGTDFRSTVWLVGRNALAGTVSTLYRFTMSDDTSATAPSTAPWAVVGRGGYKTVNNTWILEGYPPETTAITKLIHSTETFSTPGYSNAGNRYGMVTTEDTLSVGYAFAGGPSIYITGAGVSATISKMFFNNEFDFNIPAGLPIAKTHASTSTNRSAAWIYAGVASSPSVASYLSSVDKLSFATDSVSARPALPAIGPGFGGYATDYATKGIIFGGVNPATGGISTSNVYRYSMATENLTAVPNLTTSIRTAGTAI